jgi:hypothetical protein
MMLNSEFIKAVLLLRHRAERDEPELMDLVRNAEAMLEGRVPEMPRHQVIDEVERRRPWA